MYASLQQGTGVAFNISVMKGLDSLWKQSIAFLFLIALLRHQSISCASSYKGSSLICNGVKQIR